MESFLAVGSIMLLGVVCLVGLVSLVFGLPGTFVILFAAAIYAWATGFAHVTWATLGWLALLAVLGEILELLLGTGIGGRARPSRRMAFAAIGGSLIGGILGAPFLFGIGAIAGTLAGAFIGAGFAAHSEGHSMVEVIERGWNALKGRFAGFVTKSVIGIAMTLLVLFAAISR